MLSDTLVERTRRLPVALDEDELAELDRRAQELQEWISREREALSHEIKSRETEIDGMEEELKLLKLDIASQCQWRDVTVSLRKDWGVRTQTVVRMDTGRIVSWRRLTSADAKPIRLEGLAGKEVYGDEQAR